MVTFAPDLRVVDTVIVPPRIEPIDLDETKKALRITTTGEDTLIDAYIAAARQRFEDLTGIQIMAATRERTIFGTIRDVVELPFPPLLEIVSAAYGDTGTETALVADTDYTLVQPSGAYPKRAALQSLSTWTLGAQTVIRYRAGFGEQPGDVPELVKVTLYQLVASFHKFRTSVQDIRPGAQMAPVGFVEDILKAFKYHALSSAVLRRSTLWV